MSLSYRTWVLVRSCFGSKAPVNLRRTPVRRHHGRARLMEFLEGRELLSVTHGGLSLPALMAALTTVHPMDATSSTLTITGNGTAITNGQTTPTTSNFTDFGSMSTTNDANVIGNVTRTYTVTNNGSTNLDLSTGSGKITVSGADAGDFTITAPTTVVTPGNSVTFTVTFAPTGTGTRSATISVSDGTTPFTFAIQGTGVATTNSADGLEVATTQAGTGQGAENGQILTINYTGYLLTGTVFDTSLATGKTPLRFRLDNSTGNTYLSLDKTGNSIVDSSLIPGWEDGLQGIKAGETRTLIIPAALGYGSAGHDSVPPNAALVFDVTCLNVGHSPAIGIESTTTGTLLTPGQTTISTADGTDFGHLATGTASASATFQLFVDSAVDASGNPVGHLELTGSGVKVGGANPKDFYVTNGTSSGQFVVTFRPTAPGTRTATITILSNDAENPRFSFEVSGSVDAFTDLALTAGTPKFPAGTIISGDKTKLTVPVVVQNNGNVAIPAGSMADVTVYLQNSTTGVKTQVTGDFAPLNVGGLAVGKTKKFNVPVTLPAGVADGTYDVVVVINASAAITESSSSNNSITTTRTLTVAEGFNDISGNLVSTKIPSIILSNTAINGIVAVAVKNAGNVTLPKGQKATVSIIAHNTVTGVETMLGTSAAASLSGLKAGKLKKVNISIKNAEGLAAGTYDYYAQITPSPALTESDTDNNLVTTTAAGGVLAVTVADPDISGVLGASTLPTTVAAGSATVYGGKLAVTVQNSGTVALPKGEQVTIEIVAHPTTALDASSDITLTASPASISVNGLKAGLTRNANVALTFAGSALPTGSYVLEAKIVASPALTEVNAANNLVSVNGAGETVGLVSA